MWLDCMVSMTETAFQVEVSKGLKEELATPGRELLKIVKLPNFPTRVCISHSHVQTVE